MRVCKTVCFGLSAMVGAVLLPVKPAGAQVSNLSKGYQLLLKQGIQTQGMISSGDVFNLGTYQSLGYTSANWMFTSDPSRSGPAPGYPWARWVDQESDMPPISDEAGEMSQLYGLSLGDELNLNDDATRTTEVQWFTDAHNNPAFDNTILYTNNYSGQFPMPRSATSSAARIQTCFFSINTRSRISGRPITPAAYCPRSSATGRASFGVIASGRSIPAFRTARTCRPSIRSKIMTRRSIATRRRRSCANNMIALAFNAKVLTGFTYNNGATSLFTAHGDSSPQTPLYAEQQIVNKRISNWSNTLVRLTPVHDMHNAADANPPAGPVSTDANFPDGTTTSMMVIRGKDASGNVNPIPIGFQPDPQAPNSYSWWEAGKNDPYLNGWSVKNIGTKNNGQPGDVIVSWFRPLDAGVDAPGFSDDIYMMVVNSLTDPTGSAADCEQEIKLNFSSLPPDFSLQMLDPDTGLLTTPSLVSLSGGKKQLVLDLDGGDAALFKFNDGAPFVGVTPEPTSAAALLAAGVLLGLRRRQSRASA